MHIDETVNAYMAGIMDGEGSFLIDKTFTRNRPYYHASMVVTSTDKCLIEWISNNFGGECKLLPFRVNKNTKQKQSWRWIVGSKISAATINRIYKYLVIKKCEADILLEYIKTVRVKGDSRLLTDEEINLREVLFQSLRLIHNKDGGFDLRKGE